MAETSGSQAGMKVQYTIEGGVHMKVRQYAFYCVWTPAIHLANKAATLEDIFKTLINIPDEYVYFDQKEVRLVGDPDIEQVLDLIESTARKGELITLALKAFEILTMPIYLLPDR